MATAYIETTIPSYYVAKPSASLIQAARQASTRRWWDKGCSDFELFTSQETLDEVGRGDRSLADERLALIQDLAVLEITDEVAALTNLSLRVSSCHPKPLPMRSTLRLHQSTRWIFL